MATPVLQRDIVVEILNALEDQRYQWRTAEGIAGSTGIDQKQIEQELDRMGDRVIRSSQRDSKGRELFATPQHYRRTHPFLHRLRDAVAYRIS